MRIFKYFILGILTVIVPYTVTIFLIMFTGDRYDGMELGVMPGLILPQLIFGLIFIKKSWATRIPIAILLTAIIYGLMLVIVKTEWIKTNFDLYGFWDLALANLIAGLIIWEIFYHVDSTFKRM